MARPAVQAALFAAAGVDKVHEGFRTLDIRSMVRPGVQAGLFVAAGVDKVRLTGGEPTLRRDLPALVGRLAALVQALDKAVCHVS